MDEASIRLTVFLSLIVVLGIAQHRYPRRRLHTPLIKRWGTNFGLVILDSIFVRIFIGFLIPVSVAAWSSGQEVGLFNLLDLPLPIAIIFSLLLLDALIYWQHRLFHRIPMLWRLHRVHHYDKDYDLSTALRFHPIEIFLSILVKNVAILLLGIPVTAVILFEITLNGMALFNHSNLALPDKADKLLRQLFVTPDMHRVHHSVHKNEMHSNFGFNLSIWDRWFGSYVAQPKDGHLDMQLGQPDAEKLPTNNLLWLLGAALRQRTKP